MSTRTLQLTESMHRYLVENTMDEPEVLRRLRAETATLAQSNMQISAEQGQFMQLLLELLSARRVLEIGTFTGYSALCMALALPADGRVIACDVSLEWTQIARRYWNEAGVGDRIDLRIGPALETLDALRDDEGPFDFAFIDADKANYSAYYDRALERLRPGGLIAIDNALWSGRVCDPAEQDDDTVAIRALNERVTADERVTSSLVPIGDGLLLARRR